MVSRYGRAGLILFAIALYGGPFLAGLAHHRWAALPVFVALLLLYAAATRKPDLATSAGWAGLAIMVAVQLGMVAVAWGAGLALAGPFGAVMLPIWAPIAITALAAGFGSWAWRDAAQMDVMLESAIRALERAGDGGSSAIGFDWPDPNPAVRAALDDTIETLRGLDKLNATLIDPVVARLEAAAGATAFDAFYDIAGQDGDDNEPMIDYALLRYVAAPGVLAALIDRGEGGLAPQLLIDAPNPDMRAEARARVADLIDAGAPANQRLDTDRLARLSHRFPGEGYTRLAAMCRHG